MPKLAGEMPVRGGTGCVQLDDAGGRTGSCRGGQRRCCDRVHGSRQGVRGGRFSRKHCRQPGQPHPFCRFEQEFLRPQGQRQDRAHVPVKARCRVVSGRVKHL